MYEYLLNIVALCTWELAFGGNVLFEKTFSVQRALTQRMLWKASVKLWENSLMGRQGDVK